MSPQTRWITLVIAAFVVTLAGLRYLNRDKPVVAFDSNAIIPFGDFRAFPFETSVPTILVIEVNSTSGIDFNVSSASKEDHQYLMKVNQGEIPRDRDITYLWSSESKTRHRSPPLSLKAGSFVLHIDNSLSSNTRQLPVKATVRAFEHKPRTR